MKFKAKRFIVEDLFCLVEVSFYDNAKGAETVTLNWYNNNIIYNNIRN